MSEIISNQDTVETSRVEGEKNIYASKRLALHSCCGSCTVSPLNMLEDYGLETSILYFNPNIHPEFEYKRRRDTLLDFCNLYKLDFHEISPDIEGLGFSKREEMWKSMDVDTRCENCYHVRLKGIASYAKDKDYDYFSTTLLGSIYQKHDKIREIGEALASEYGIPFLYVDFRPEFRQGQNKARELGLYRQKYCGCAASLMESSLKDKILKSFKD